MQIRQCSCKRVVYVYFLTALSVPVQQLSAGECEQWSNHPEWLWCDDFEDVKPLGEKYQDVSTSGFERSADEAFDGSHSLRQHYTEGQVDAGWVIRVENNGFPEHLFYRWYHKFEKGFNGFPPKMARVRYRIRSGEWNSLLGIHCWIDNGNIVADVSAKNSSQTTGSGWLPIARSPFSFDSTDNIDRWICFEMEVQLNTPGKSDGLYRIWADSSLIVERLNVDLRGTETYRCNEVMLDCYWNGGSPKEQNRYYDNFVISTLRIGDIKRSSLGNFRMKRITPEERHKIQLKLRVTDNNRKNLQIVIVQGDRRWYDLLGNRLSH